MPVIAVIGIAVAAAVLFSIGVSTKLPFRISFVDAECDYAQQNYYNARDRARSGNNQVGSEVQDAAKKEHEHADVCAQNRMAQAAEWGLLLLLGTLVFSAIAARAAWKTVETMRVTARQQLRAYVSILSAKIWVPAENRIEVAIDLKNFGQTPAYKFQTWCKLNVFPVNATNFDDRSFEAYSVLGPTAMSHLNVSHTSTDEEVDGVNNGTHAIFVWGKVEYVDAFGSPQWMTFRLRQGHGIPGVGFAAQPCATGNDAS